jgi:hypothetical protein
LTYSENFTLTVQTFDEKNKNMLLMSASDIFFFLSSKADSIGLKL